MGNIVMNIDVLGSGTDQYVQASTLISHINRLTVEIGDNAKAIAVYKQAVAEGLRQISNAANELSAIIEGLSGRIEQLKGELDEASNKDKELASIQKLQDEKDKLIEVITYANGKLGRINLNNNNNELNVADLNADAGSIIKSLTAAIERGNAVLNGGGGGGGLNLDYAAGQANVDDITDTKLKDYVNGVIGKIVSTPDQDKRTQLLTEATYRINSNTTAPNEDKTFAIQLITEKYNRRLKGGKRPHRSHRHRRTKKSRTHKKSKKSRKINYKGGYRAKFVNDRGRGSRKRDIKHTSHRQ
jgi:hypothetical protein